MLLQVPVEWFVMWIAAIVAGPYIIMMVGAGVLLLVAIVQRVFSIGRGPR